jgi:hypothetical protein
MKTIPIATLKKHKTKLIAVIVVLFVLMIYSCSRTPEPLSDADITNYETNDTDRKLLREWSDRAAGIRAGMIDHMGFDNFIGDPRNAILPIIRATRSMDWDGASPELRSAVAEVKTIKEGDDSMSSMPKLQSITRLEIKY